MSNTVEFKNKIAFHPGYYVNQLMEEMEINQAELAKRLNTTAKNLSELINGKTDLSADMAISISSMTGTSVEVWLNLRNQYQSIVLEKEKYEKQKHECDLLKCLDYEYFIKTGAVEDVKECHGRVDFLVRHFKISSLDVLTKNDFLVQYRAYESTWTEIDLMNANAWVQSGLRFAENIATSDYDENVLKDNLKRIRLMTSLDPSICVDELRSILADSGIALIVTPKMKNCKVTGAVKWVGKDNNKAVVIMNDRKKTADVFWFSLFHELRHVMQRKVKRVIINMEETNEYDLKDEHMQLEKQADDFARNILIPEKPYKKFLSEKTINRNTVIEFANDIYTHPGIVAGRLQKDGIIKYSMYNDLKMKYEFTEYLKF